jgi:hypothetical protein
MPLAERDRRALIIFGVVIVVAALAYFLFLRPKGTESPTAIGPSTGVTTPPPTSAPTTSPPVTPVTPRTPPPSGFLVGKDPFSPLVNPSGGGGPTSTSTSVPTGTNPFTTSPFTTSPFTTTPGTSPTSTTTNTVSPTGGSNGGTTTHVGGHTVTLIDIFTRNGVQMAQVQVDSTGYTVREGQTFAANYKLVAIAGSCASFSHGSEHFVLCENPQK